MNSKDWVCNVHREESLYSRNYFFVSFPVVCLDVQLEYRLALNQHTIDLKYFEYFSNFSILTATDLISDIFLSQLIILWQKHLFINTVYCTVINQTQMYNLSQYLKRPTSNKTSINFSYSWHLKQKKCLEYRTQSID